VVQHLLSSGANIGVSDKDNNLPLFEACRNGHISVARVLISKGVPIDAQNIQVQISCDCFARRQLSWELLFIGLDGTDDRE
jgi:ankyrin repeat protein